MIRSLVKELLHYINLDIRRYSIENSHDLRRQQLFELLNIDLVLDVGANSGQYGKQLRKGGYKGKILSFEPITSVYNDLKNKADTDGNWDCIKTALGNSTKDIAINISKNLASSSILEMESKHLDDAPESVYISKEIVRQTTLDNIVLSQEIYKKSNIYLKIDTQGYEMQVLTGAEQSFEYIKAIEVELSLVPLYHGQALLPEISDLLYSRGYVLYSINDVFVSKKNGQVLQIDGLFVKNELI
jgi:FkbM family methyltransferase